MKLSFSSLDTIIEHLIHKCKSHFGFHKEKANL